MVFDRKKDKYNALGFSRIKKKATQMRLVKILVKF